MNTTFLWSLIIPPVFPEADRQGLVSLLGPEEQNRYQKIGHEGRRIEYILGHALLRLQVSEFLGMEPRQLPLRWVEKKPVLEGGGQYVSLTHKKGSVAAALAPTPIGIDLEIVEESLYAAEIVRRFFSEGEQETILGLEGAERTLRFTQLWALKEALFKGVDHPIETIFRQTEFEIKKDGGVNFASHLPDLKPSEWQFQFLNPRLSHLLALAVQTRDALPLRVVEKLVSVTDLTS